MRIKRPGKSSFRNSGVIAIVLFVAAAATAGGEEHSEGISARRDCGAYAVGVMLGLLDVERPPFETIRRDTRVDDNGVTSMLHLVQALRGYGVHVEVVELSETPPRGPVIAKLAGRNAESRIGHFVVVSPGDDGHVVVCSPPFWVRKSAWNELQSRFEGKMLLCSRASPRRGLIAFGALGGVLIALGAGAVVLRWTRGVRASGLFLLGFLLTCCGVEEPPFPRGVRLDPAFKDLGLQDPGKHMVPLTLANHSGTARTIESIDTSCTCALVDLKPGDVLAPGERRRVETEIKVTSDSSLTTLVSVKLDDGSRATSYLKSRGGPARGIDMPRHLDLGPVPLRTSQTFSVSATMDPAVDVKRDQQGRVLDLRWTVHGNSCVRLAQHHQEPAEHNKSRLTAEFVVTPDTVGPTDATVLLEAGFLRMRCDVRWTVSLPLKVDPTHLVLRSDGARLRGRIAVRLPEGWTFLNWKPTDDSVTVATCAHDDLVIAEVTAPASFADGGGMCEIWAAALNPQREHVQVPVRVVAELNPKEATK